MLSMLIAMETFRDSLARRFRSLGRNERGQTAAEYLGIIVVVAGLIMILATSPIGDRIKDAITDQIDRIIRSGG
jgi:pilus assembly protein Flp/PilA